MNATATELKTCKVVIIEPGLPNSGIRVYPAEHEKEVVDTTSRPGQERWEQIQQIINRFSEPGKHIPKPISFNPDHPKNAWNPAPSDDQLPVVKLVDFVLKPLPEQKRPSMPNPQENQKAMAERMDRLENKLEKLTDALLNMNGAAPKRGRPKKSEAQ